jgi:hypothetical protein
MNGPRFKYLMLILCSVFLGVAALLGYLARSYDMPLSVLLLSACSPPSPSCYPASGPGGSASGWIARCAD